MLIYFFQEENKIFRELFDNKRVAVHKFKFLAIHRVETEVIVT